MSTQDGLRILQSAVVLFLAPLYAGVLARAEAIVQSKRGPSVLQPYRDGVTPIFERYLYQPLIRVIEKLARLARPIQSGDVNLYVLYVFVVVLIAYAVYT